MTVSDLDAPAILAFLGNLEAERNNAVHSRNARLSAIRSFFRVVALRDPASVGIVTRVLAIPVKRTEKRLVGYLTRPEMVALLAAPDQTGWLGRRDHALLLTMYNSGARASEITSLRRGQVHFDTTTYLQLHGKGRKERTVPLWPTTARVLQQWFREREGRTDAVVFPTIRGTSLSSDGLDHLLQQAVRRASEICPSLLNKRITPHLVRHTTAMHLLQAGVDITVIALWLGHENIETTHIYLEADLALKERALEKVTPVQGARCCWRTRVSTESSRTPRYFKHSNRPGNATRVDGDRARPARRSRRVVADAHFATLLFNIKPSTSRLIPEWRRCCSRRRWPPATFPAAARCAPTPAVALRVD